MSGWKTKVGAGLTIIATAYNIYTGLISFAEGLQVIGSALMAVGIGHKIEKAGTK